MDVLKRAVDNLRKTWAGLSPARRVVLVVALASLVPLLVWAAAASTTDGMVKVAGADMREDERAQIVKKLQEKSQKFDVRDGGIYLPEADAERVMFELNADGVFSDEAIWKVVLESNIMDTGKDKDMKFQIARQRKLERTIRSIKGVRNAAVQVTTPAASERFFSSDPKASASVQVELAAGTALRQENVDAIAGLVARSVAGLDPDRVHIMDTSGHPYRVRKSDGAAVGAADIRDIEIQYEDQIKAKLEHLFPQARFVVRVQAQSKDTQTEDVKLTSPVTEYERERIVTVRSGSVGATPTIKGGSTVEPAPETPSFMPQSEKEFETKSRSGSIKKLIRDPAGAVEKITVGVLIPVREADLDRERQSEAAYKEIIMKAAGPQADKDSVSLMFVPTRPPAPLPQPDFWDDAREFLSAQAPAIGIVILALVVLGILYAVLKRATPQGVVEELQALQSRLSEEAALLPAPGVPLGEEDVARVRLGLKDMVTRNPRAVAGILKRWLAGK